MERNSTDKDSKQYKKQKSILSQETIAEVQTKDASIQTEVIQRDYVPMSILKSYKLESKAYPSFLYRSHTITGLLFIIALIFLGQKYYTIPEGEDSLMRNGHKGLLFTALIFVVYGMIYFPNTIMQRPHPAFWRIVHAVGIFWLGCLTFVNFFSKDDFQKFLKVAIDPNLGSPIAEKHFAQDCRLYTPENPNGMFYNLTSSIDIFFAAHVTGWMFKMLISRDFKLCMLQSIIFELLEITFRHWLPNFYECWWDHIILDLILCNTGGMLIGWGLIKLYKMKQYRWSLRTTDSKSYFQNLKELFFSIDLDQHNWKMLSSTKNFLGVCFFLFIFQLLDLSFFFNKFVLHIQPSHMICIIRTWLLGFLCIPSAREYFEFYSNPNVKRLGPYCWNLFAILIMESLLFFNNINLSQFSKPFPWYVKLIWFCIGSVFAAIFIVLIYNDIRRWLRSRKNNNIKKEEENKHIKQE